MLGKMQNLKIKMNGLIPRGQKTATASIRKYGRGVHADAVVTGECVACAFPTFEKGVVMFQK